MSIAPSNSINLYYEVHGAGPNLVLIEGIGYHTWMWFRQLPAFTPRFRTLIYDNRGVGRSDMPEGPYNHGQNADDLAGLLDYLGWERTHVLGISMGGFIAQEIALKYPQRVNRLVLAATAFGGPNMVPVPRDALAAMMPDPKLMLRERIVRAAPISYGDPGWPEKNPDTFEQIIRWREERPQPPQAAMAQAMAAVTFNTEDRLKDITAPTLVITGAEDRVVPPRNAELLAEKIPGARLVTIAGAGHLGFIEKSDEFNEAVIDFLSSEP
jgi:pimeloyl-ACP methyl ester carboxylesterase